MKYMSGIEVMEGDIVALEYDQAVEGVVLQVLLPNTPEADAWSKPEGGVLVEGCGIGLWVTASLEDAEDIVFVRRASKP